MSRVGKRVMSVAVVLVVLFCSAFVWADTTSRPAPSGGKSAAGRVTPRLIEVVRAQVKARLDDLEKHGDFEKTAGEIRKLFEQVAAYGSVGAPEPFVEAAAAYRLVRQLGGLTRTQPGLRPTGVGDGLDKDKRLALLKFLRADEPLARAMAFAVRSDLEDPSAVYAVLEKLRAAHGGKLKRFPNLAAAISVVHDVPLVRRLNENTVRASDPVQLFAYYVSNEARMFFGLRNVAPEVLVYVVDSCASIKEMKWALSRYHGNAAVGKLYAKVDYDWDHYRKGAVKKVTAVGAYHLPNILKYGGVCVDQAYFAVAVGKSIGVPTCQVIGQGGNTSHAWVGFFQVVGKRGFWNFKYGRYEQYCKIRGQLEDPQTRQRIPDDWLSVQAELLKSSTANRHAAIAFVDAARLMADAGNAFRPEPFGVRVRRGDVQATPRKADIGTRLALIQHALGNHAIGYVPGWLLVSGYAQAGEMTLAHKKHWSDTLQKLCGARYPEFCFAVIKPMVESVEETAEQAVLWDALRRFFRARKDLVARILMAKGAMWEKAGESKKAGKCYEQVVARHMNDGPFALTALDKCQEQLRKLGKEKDVPRLYLAAWKKCRKPDKMASRFTRYSNWFRVGVQFAQILRDAGYDSQAAKVINELQSTGTRVKI